MKSCSRAATRNHSTGTSPSCSNRFGPSYLLAVFWMAKSSLRRNGGLDFESLQLRIHPAASRVKLLSNETPASIVIFDLLSEGNQDLRSIGFQERRQRLEAILSTALPPIHLTPATTELSVASDWFRRFEGAGLDGVMAKRASGPYESNKRVMLKVKHERDCDCVVGGFRWHRKGERTAIGSLLLGLYDDSGALQHVGVCGSFTDKRVANLSSILLHTATTHSPIIPGNAGRSTKQ